MYSPVTAFTDNMAAKYILTSERPNTARRAKLVALFSEFENVSLQHIAGKSNKVADFLSRIGNPYEDDDGPDKGHIMTDEHLPPDPEPEKQVLSCITEMIAEYSRKQSALSPEKVEIGTQTDESLYTMDIERKDWEPIKTDKLPTVATIDGEENTSEAAKSLLDLILKDQAAQEKLERYQNEDEYM